MFKASKRPASMCIEELCMRSAREASYKYGVDYDRLYKIANKGNEAFTEFEDVLNQELENNMQQIIKSLKKQGAVTRVALDNNIRNVTELFASIYTFRNCKRLIYDSGKSTITEFLSHGVPESIKQYDFMEIFDDVDDMILDIKTKEGYSPFMIRICRAVYKIDNNRGTDMDSFNITYLLNDQGRSKILAQFAVVRGMFPHLLIEHRGICEFASDYGDKCPRCVTMDTTYKNAVIKETREMCFITEKKMNERACFLSLLRPYDVLKVAAYVWDMYKNRHTLERKNSKRREHYKTHEVSVVDTEDRLIKPMHSYYRYEQEKKPWQGGHHQSPVEHERRSHERVYRNEDGSIKKIVQVKGSTINKGGKRAFYKVDKPDDKMDLF